MRILGIDPGLATLGYGVIDTQGSKITLITAGAVITPPDMITPDRLVKIRCDIRELLTVYQPQEISRNSCSDIIRIARILRPDTAAARA